MSVDCHSNILDLGTVESGSWTNIRSLHDGLWILAQSQPLYQVLRIKVDANGIFSKFLCVEKLCGFLDCVKVVDLYFNLVSVRVLVVHARGRSMVHAPDGHNPTSFALPVRDSEILQVRKSICDVL